MNINQLEQYIQTLSTGKTKVTFQLQFKDILYDLTLKNTYAIGIEEKEILKNLTR
jgi:hypothetical protein